ncbi:helicase IV [Oxobacter pfennigii]|uniref:DNA 3'-5' helicase n=1 Tax=Oxobacter pfennigii TaxID=36849 RepID=A0A0P8X1Q3_9CLOT|nr:RNA polymerase recycling motor HelD [Oxobacter pfennigii]KPU44749.1 helicase IV [Oxobacter pfennigii]
MSAKNHPDFMEEKEHLDYTLGYVKENLESSIKEKQRIDQEVSSAKRHFDSSESQSYIGLMVNTMLQDRVELRVKNLEKAEGRPYFARIDFKEEGKKVPEKLYIGKMVLIRDEDQELIIVDWRAPIANLYYEARLGEAGYLCPDGNISGDLTLKRQFTIDDGILKEIFDIDITTNDEFLQTYLGANADNRLKDIVSTIQVEQNQIIRADMWKPLIVQGAAGSGKTTIALHRIAYLIYTFEKRFNPENFMIIASNKLFLNYISTVLPELGVERVKQSTFQDFALELIGEKLKIKDTSEKLIRFVNNNTTQTEIKENVLLRKVSELKSSILFKEVLDDYVSIIEEKYIPNEDFKIASYTVFTYDEINKLFLNEYRHLPLMKRVQEIKKHLTNGLKRRKESLVERLQYNCDRTVARLKSTMEDTAERRSLIIEAIDFKDNTIKGLEKESKKVVKDYIAGISKANPFQYYKDFINDRELFHKLLKEKIADEDIEPVRKYSLVCIRSGLMEIEDLAPLIYLKYCIYGMDEKIPVRHVVIDEAQDFSVFQFYVLKKIIPESSFTILGDLCQGIHSYRGTMDWKDVMKYAFEDSNCQLLTLEQSYRTTVEITEAANSVINKIGDSNLPLSKPVIRHGEKVSVIKKDSRAEIANDIREKIKEFTKAGFKSVAIITKTMESCEDMLSYFKKDKNSPYIITGNEKEYKGGVVIVPSYLVKGLEFDVCFIADGEGEQYKDTELDAKLLYVSMTRPLHKLYIYYTGTLSSLLNDVGR